MKNNIFFFSLFCIFSCNKTSKEDIFNQTLSQLQFKCDGLGAEDSLYIKAKIGADSFCISDGSGYRLVGELGTSLQTTTNSVILSDTNTIRGKYLNMSFMNSSLLPTLTNPFIYIAGPMDDKHTTYSVLCEKYLKVGTYPIRSIANNENEGYKVSINFPYQALESGANRLFSITSAQGAQFSDAQLIIETVQKWSGRGGTHYRVKGHFKCNLYSTFDLNQTGKLAKVIEDAQFVQKFVVP
jgi:hypothetical protein